MNIGVIGAGRIGGTVAKRLSRWGHRVKIANSRDPHTIRSWARMHNIEAVRGAEVAKDVDVLVTSVPFHAIPSLRDFIREAPHDVLLIDTSNYFPFRDGSIPELEKGKVESQWVSEQLDRPVVKAWNNILAGSFAEKSLPVGAAGRIALAVSGDNSASKTTARELVELTGFDTVDAGTIAESWRQQPGTPGYCTDLGSEELKRALSCADRSISSTNRDLMVKMMQELDTPVTNAQLLQLNREIFLCRK